MAVIVKSLPGSKLPPSARLTFPSLSGSDARPPPIPRATWFLTSSSPATARKTWIAGALEPKGALRVDAGAARALRGGASLLPIGVTGLEGPFCRGDAVLVRDGAGAVLGRGLVAYDADEAGRILGRSSREIEAILGYPGRAEMIHRDDLALSTSQHA